MEPKIDRTPYIIKGKLPLIFPNLHFACLNDFGRATLDNVDLAITTAYHLFKDVKRMTEFKYKFEVSTVYTIMSEHDVNENYFIFHELIKEEIENFKREFAALNLKNYPRLIFPKPTIEQIRPRLEELFNPNFGQSLN